MSDKIDIERFIMLYNNLIPKIQIINSLNITEYMYEKIIQIYGLSRSKTCKTKRLYVMLQQNKAKHIPIDVSYASFNKINNKI